ncbi:hypothetical protein AGOR_G00125570 [Albula goreensis]|uniref:Uncharacterized protein n=1 Tax=Albula goreensis TaxID=1534307 RepID=A0A8T3DF63_9TELE|nr:hypothetical protein AGOR_G00125570 [Albula goreensis]
MSQAMNFESPRTSVFTFQSSVHSSHVLRCLDEQRRKDILCDVTVIVENKSYRAHRSVLAACSDYFHNRVTNQVGQGLVITLPEEVTMEGFDPLLEFAYSAKLLFTKENIVEIHNCATILGFHNLEKACFDFLIPKFDSGKSINEIQKKVCCKNKCSKQKSLHAKSCCYLEEDDQAEDTNDETSSPVLKNRSNGLPSQNSTSEKDLPEACSPSCLEKHAQTHYSPLCPKYRKFQMACGKDRCSLDDCSLQMSANPIAVTNDGYASPCLPHTSDKNDRSEGNQCDQTLSETGNVPENEWASCMPATSKNSLTTGREVTPELGYDQPTAPPVAALDCCPVGPVDTAVTLERDEILGCGGDEGPADFNPSDSALSEMVQEGGADRSSVEREVAEHLAKGFWPDPCPSRTGTLLLDSEEQQDLGKAADFHWLKQLDLTASTGDCPFLRELGDGVQLPESEGMSQPEKSPYVSSINSGDDSDCDTEGDSESYNNERAREVHLPFPVEQISSMSRNDFQHMLRLQTLTREQLDFVHDVRRRSKNRIAAQRCRKRKLDCIVSLEGEIHQLKGEKEKLMQERDKLKRCKGETLQSLSTLCHKVCSEATLTPDQLEFLAQYSSPDCPASVLMTPTPSPSLSLHDQDPPIAGISLDSCPTEEPTTHLTPQLPHPTAPPSTHHGTTHCPTTEQNSPTST